jgi:hypothetical protein
MQPWLKSPHSASERRSGAPKRDAAPYIEARTQSFGVPGEPSRLDTDLVSIRAARTGLRRRRAASRLPAALETLFHPAVANWFAESFAAPTAAQAEAWPAIKAGRHTLIAAPT